MNNNRKLTYKKNIGIMTAAILTASLVGTSVMPVMAKTEVKGEKNSKSKSILPRKIHVDSPIKLRNIELPETEYGKLKWEDKELYIDQHRQEVNVIFTPFKDVDLSIIKSLEGYDPESKKVYYSLTVVVDSVEDSGEENSSDREMDKYNSFDKGSESKKDKENTEDSENKESFLDINGEEKSDSLSKRDDLEEKSKSESINTEEKLEKVKDNETIETSEAKKTDDVKATTNQDKENTSKSHKDRTDNKLHEQKNENQDNEKERLKAKRLEEIKRNTNNQKAIAKKAKDNKTLTILEDILSNKKELDKGINVSPKDNKEEKAEPLDNKKINSENKDKKEEAKETEKKEKAEKDKEELNKELIKNAEETTLSNGILSGKELERFKKSSLTSNGIKVSGDLPWYVEFKAEPAGKESFSLSKGADTFKSYEFSLWDVRTNTEYKLSDNQFVTVSIPVKQGYTYLVEHILETGGRETITPVEENGYISFVTYSFSPFGIAGSKSIVGGDISKKFYHTDETNSKPKSNTAKVTTEKANSTKKSILGKTQTSGSLNNSSNNSVAGNKVISGAQINNSAKNKGGANLSKNNNINNSKVIKNRRNAKTLDATNINLLLGSLMAQGAIIAGLWVGMRKLNK